MTRIGFTSYIQHIIVSNAYAMKRIINQIDK